MGLIMRDMTTTALITDILVKDTHTTASIMNTTEMDIMAMVMVITVKTMAIMLNTDLWISTNLWPTLLIPTMEEGGASNLFLKEMIKKAQMLRPPLRQPMKLLTKLPTRFPTKSLKKSPMKLPMKLLTKLHIKLHTKQNTTLSIQIIFMKRPIMALIQPVSTMSIQSLIT